MMSNQEWRSMHGCHQPGRTDLEFVCYPAHPEPRMLDMDITNVWVVIVFLLYRGSSLCYNVSSIACYFFSDASV